MPRIKRAYLDSVFYLYENEEDAINGEKAGGTGFFIGVKSEAFPHRTDDVYAITCKHNVKPPEGAGHIACPVMRVNTTVSGEEGKEWDKWRTETFALTQDDWYSFEQLFPGENHDLAIREMRELSPSQETQFIRGPLLTKIDFEGSVVGYGDDVFMVGRYIDHDGTTQNLPSVRFGNISILLNSSEPLINREMYDEPSFVIEMRSLSGYSGSPVFLYIPDQSLRYAHATMLLGIQWSHQPYWEYIREAGGYVKVYSGMANVIPAWHISRMLNWEEFKMQRQQADDDYAGTPAANRPQQILTSAQKRDDEDALTEGEFFDALDKVIRPIEDDDEDGNE